MLSRPAERERYRGFVRAPDNNVERSSVRRHRLPTVAATLENPQEPMDIVTLAAPNLDRHTVRRLSRRSDVRGALQLSCHVLLLCATGAWVWMSRGSLWIAPAIVVHGIALNFLFCALHESIHRTAFASRRLNDSVAWVCGGLLLLPPEYFRLFHLAHHRCTQEVGRDPELARASPTSLAAYLWRMCGLPNWYERLISTLRHALTGRVPESYVPASKRSAVVLEARALWSCYVGIVAISILFARLDAVIYWLLPALAGQPALRLFLMAEHSGCEFSTDMFRNTRTTYTNGALRFLAWQMPYHAEHHAFPSVPFHALPRVNALARACLAVTAPGYLALHCSLVRKFRTCKAPRSVHTA